MKQLLAIFSFIILLSFLSSCSDAEIVEGTFHGKLYRTDTIDASARIFKVSDAYIGIEVTSPWMNEAYIDYAKLSMNATEAYDLQLLNDTGGLSLTGYYYEGFVQVYSWSNDYVFEGHKE